MEKETKTNLPKEVTAENKTAKKTTATTAKTEVKSEPKKAEVKAEVKAEPVAKTVESKTTIEKTVNSKPVMVEEEVKKPTKPVKISKDAHDNRKIAWLAYILFFIPLLINRTSPFVRHHANEGLEINVFDGIGAILLLLGAFVRTEVAWLQLLMIIFTVIGFILIVLTTVTKVYMIASTLRGKTVSTPWMWNVRIIK